MKKQGQNSIALDLFLLMFNLSQFTLKEKIINVFIGAMSEIWPEIIVSYLHVKPDSEENIVEISASGSNYGYLRIEDITNIKDVDLSLLHNSLAMLAVILKKNEQDTLLSDEKLHLQKLVDERLSAISESEAKYRNIFENIQDVFYETSLNGIILEVSPSISFISKGQYCRTDLIGKLMFDFYKNPERSKDLLLALNDKGYVNEFDIQLINLDGSEIQCSITSKVLFSDSGLPLKIVGTMRDITNRRMAEQNVQASQAKLSKALEVSNQSRQSLLSVLEDQREAEKEIQKLNSVLEQRVIERTAQLEASNKELEAFSYSVSHDLRAPLRHINGFVDLLSNQFEGELPDKAHHYLDTISGASRQMGNLIDELLQYSRTGRQEVTKTQVDMNLLVKEVTYQLKTGLEERKINWDIQQLPKVSGDIVLLKQVWANLLDNAVKYTRNQKTTEISVGCREETKEFMFWVKDNGAGFDMKYAHKLFGVFQRLHSKAEFEGTGIGLANVQRIVHKHLGRVWAEAEPGKGAKFYFSLPKYQEENR